MNCNRLNIHTIDTVFDKMQFTGIVRVVYIFIERSFNISDCFSSFFSGRSEVRFGSFINGKLQEHIFPTTIIWINLFEDMYHLLEHTHGECARTASWIENLTTVERLHNRQLLLFGEHGFAVGIGKQLTIFVLQVITNRAFEVSDKTFIDHILHNLARSIERTRLFSGSLLRFGVVRRQQILEYFTEQFRVKRHILIKGHIFFHSEVIAFENINDTTSRYLLLVGISVEIREVNVLARFLTKEKIVWHNQLCH